MPSRTVPLATKEHYHIFNRGVEKRPIFSDKRDFHRFILTISYYNSLPRTIKLSDFLRKSNEQKELLLSSVKQTANEILCFVLMPNHYHLLIKQSINNGISSFLKEVSNSYTRYFNTRHDRIGPLFQGAFKAVHIEDDNQLMHVSRYIHLNPLTSYVVKNHEQLINYPWSSLKEYISNIQGDCNTQTILAMFSNNKQKYLQFVLDNADYQKKLQNVKHLLFE